MFQIEAFLVQYSYFISLFYFSNFYFIHGRGWRSSGLRVGEGLPVSEASGLLRARVLQAVHDRRVARAGRGREPRRKATSKKIDGLRRDFEAKLLLIDVE